MLQGCSSPDLALRDLEALHVVDEEQDRLRHNRGAELYTGYDRFLVQSGFSSYLAQLGHPIEPSSGALEHPEGVVVDRLLELRDTPPEDTFLLCKSIYWCSQLLMDSPAPLARATSAENLAVFGRALAVEVQPRARDGEAEVLVQEKVAGLLAQYRKDFAERRAVRSRGEEIPAEMLARHRQVLVALREQVPTDTYHIKSLILALPLFLNVEPSAELLEELRTTCRTLGGAAIVIHLRAALEREEPNEFARATVARSWLEVAGDAGVQELLARCSRGDYDSETVRRRLIEVFARYTEAQARELGILDWLVDCTADEERRSSLLARRALRSITGMRFNDAAEWAEAIRRAPQPASDSSLRNQAQQ